MNITHKVKIYLRDNDTIFSEFLSDKGSANIILFTFLQNNKGKRFFIESVDICSGKKEELSGFLRDGVCYYLD